MSDREKKILNCFTDLQRAAVACATQGWQTEKIFLAHAQKILHDLRLPAVLWAIRQAEQMTNSVYRADKLLTLGLRLKGGWEV
ncbi:MAG: hypothetical protein ABH807_00810 [Candidatus Shapirobacteria bacterium]